MTAAGELRKNPSTPRRRPRSLNRGRGFATIALAPFLAFLAVFALYPLGELVRLAFSDTQIVDGLFVSSSSGFANFAEVWADPTTQQSVVVTILFIAVTVIGTVGLGTTLALLVDRAGWSRALARNVFVWPAVVAPVVVSLMWLLLLSPTVGGFNKVLLNWGLPTQSWLNSESGAFLSVAVVDIWHWTPIVFLFVYAALQGVSKEVLEAARMDGATEWQITMRVVIPMLMPAILVVTLVRLVSSIKAFDEMYLLTRGGPNGATNIVSLHIRTLFFDQLEFGTAAALSVSVVAIVLAVVGGAFFARRISALGIK
ncbi:carbohydrate ABC transporter membrane protein 1 (CUT1 family) [Paramicrobacterium agarici]|uniref:Carbohydrate ABC transporter membrane protein 1 (CUT1 family) n=1 Tax=Paramicrobacterium agarici TaxID=630514 RepID=A0A2A9DUR8_9MICO|nr:carbohydrate ABC transporter membrane protein 1 (CUT1 family) [Microbacterium agarici]